VTTIDANNAHHDQAGKYEPKHNSKPAGGIVPSSSDPRFGQLSESTAAQFATRDARRAAWEAEAQAIAEGAEAELLSYLPEMYPSGTRLHLSYEYEGDEPYFQIDGVERADGSFIGRFEMPSDHVQMLARVLNTMSSEVGIGTWDSNVSEDHYRGEDRIVIAFGKGAPS